MKKPAIYMLTNYTNKVLYTGVTSNIAGRTWQHKNKLIDGFTKKYNVNKLVYYEIYQTMYDALSREKQIKNWRREKKEKLINKLNPEWRDLNEDIFKIVNLDSSTPAGRSE
jgi:putative endonuclease